MYARQPDAEGAAADAALLPENRAAVRPMLLDGFSGREDTEPRRLFNKACANLRRSQLHEFLPGDPP